MKIKQLLQIRVEHLHKLFNKIKTYISPFLNWRILVIYVPIWFIMSGWTYLFIFLGTRYKISWMLAAGTFWATILWLPITPEKLLTIPLTMWIYIRWRNKEDTISDQLQLMLAEARKDWDNTVGWFRRNYSKIIKTLIVLLGTMLLLVILGLILMG